MSQKQWWILANEQKYGPFPAEQLRQLADCGKLHPDMQVIATGMQTPVAARSVAGLFNQPATQATEPKEQRKPPIVALPSRTPTVVTVETSVTKSEQQKVAISPTMLAAWLLVGVLAVSGATFIVWHSRSRHQAEVAAADAQASKSIANAQAWIAGGSSLDVALVEQALAEVLQNQLTTKKTNADAALTQVRGRRQQLAEQALVAAADAVFDQARQQLDGNQVQEAISLLRKYVIDPRGTRAAEAHRLLDEAEVAISETETQKSIASMTDDQLATAANSLAPDNPLAPEIPDGKVTNPALKRIRAEIASRHLVTEIQRRNDRKVVAEKRLEAERLAAIERQRVEQAASIEAAKLNEAKQREDKRNAIAMARRDRERNGRIAFDFDKAEYARQRMRDVLQTFTLELGTEAEQAASGKLVNGAMILSQMGQLYLADRFNGKDIEDLLAKPLSFKKTVRADYSTRSAVEQLVTEYGAMRCGETSFSCRWMWNEAKLRMAEDAELR